MGLRCSLLGHDYGEPEVDREREERGSEVVLTVQTYEECARCGDRHIISENTEITSLTPDERNEAETDDRDRDTGAPPESATASGRDGSGGREPGPPTADGNTAETQTDDEQDWRRTRAETASGRSGKPVRGPGGGDSASNDRTPASPAEGTETAGANTDGGTRSEDPNAEARPEPATPAEGNDSDAPDRNVPTDENGEPIEDGEILEEENDRKPGEWPDPDDVGPPTGEGSRERWPDLEIDRVGGEELTYEDAPDEEPADERPDPKTGSGSAVTDSGTGIASAASAPTPGEDPAVDPVDTEFYCPTCSFVAPGDHGSLRPGDICPDCGRGYIGERERK